MRNEFAKQFRHFWRTFTKIVDDFENDFWFDSGFALTTPARTAYHIIKSTKYYIGDRTQIKYNSGRSIDLKRNELQESDLPSKDNILCIIDTMADKTDNWLHELDFEAKNKEYNWTGESLMSVAFFLIM